MRSLTPDDREGLSSAPFSTFRTTQSVVGSDAGLQMAHTFQHEPVMIEEVLAAVSVVPSGVIIDATLGGAGHSARILSSRDDVAVLGVDRDAIARAAATERLTPFGERARVVEGAFASLAQLVASNEAWIAGRPITGVLFDLGVSSPQFDDPSRGFSFRADAPLDMRMDRSQGITAAEYLDQVEPTELVRLLRAHGEQKFASVIARIVLERQPATTGELVACVERAIPAAARRRGHVATRVFQALRVVVNDEEEQLVAGLDAAGLLLASGGALMVIAYHSGEDHVAKQFIRHAVTGGCTCPALLDCVCGATATMTVRRMSAQTASVNEVAMNPRARSARLRVAYKVAT